MVTLDLVHMHSMHSVAGLACKPAIAMSAMHRGFCMIVLHLLMSIFLCNRGSRCGDMLHVGVHVSVCDARVKDWLITFALKLLMLQQVQVNLILDLGRMFSHQRIFTSGIAIVTLIP